MKSNRTRIDWINADFFSKKESAFIRLIRSIRVLLLFQILIFTNPGHAQDTPSFTVAEYAFQVRCAAINRPAIAIIHWTSGGEENVVTYKVHRTALTEPEEHRWVNRFPLTAMGPESTYRIIDSEAMPGMTYRYRVYGFEESGRLSLATWALLDEAVQPSCFYFPTIER